jgi:hypothetical protein
MAEITRATPTGWEQWDETQDISRATPTGWVEIDAPPAEEADIIMTWTL